MSRTRFVTLALLLSFASPLFAQDAVLHAYGPGGPAPAMKEAAKAFETSTGVKVEVTAGPTSEWVGKALADADIVFSGSEHMMTSFVAAMKGQILEPSIEPLYMRPSTILVRPGNPKRVRGIRDLLEPGVKILVVDGAGQVGLWEDVAGRLGDIKTVRRFRKNIVAFAKNSGDAKEKWTADATIDAWLIWNIWEIANDKIADAVPVEPQLRIWRDCGVALTTRAAGNANAAAFVTFLKSRQGRAIFERWGWK